MDNCVCVGLPDAPIALDTHGPGINRPQLVSLFYLSLRRRNPAYLGAFEVFLVSEKLIKSSRMGTNSIKASSTTTPKRTVKTILVSQPKPERSPYYEIEKKFGIQIDWRPFNHVEAVTEKEFRKNRIRPDEFQALVMTSKKSIDHIFSL
jgi:hypothetical protein